MGSASPLSVARASTGEPPSFEDWFKLLEETDDGTDVPLSRTVLSPSSNLIEKSLSGILLGVEGVIVNATLLSIGFGVASDPMRASPICKAGNVGGCSCCWFDNNDRGLVSDERGHAAGTLDKVSIAEGLPLRLLWFIPFDDIVFDFPDNLLSNVLLLLTLLAGCDSSFEVV